MGSLTGRSRPGYDDVVEEVERVREKAGALCEVRTLGRSIAGRDIPCVVLSDPSQPEEKKQRVLVVAGQHGTEESGRAIALELLSFLASGEPEPAEVLRRQSVAVVPCANPDGAVGETYRNADDVDVAHTYALDAPAGTPEGRAIEEFALGFAPEVVADIHGRAGGGMKDTVWLSRPLAFSPDRHFLLVMGLEMTRAAEEAGFPQCAIQPPRVLGKEVEGLSLGTKLAAEVKSLGFGVETIEHYYREPEWRADGLVRLRRLLRFGMEDAFGLGEPGYPAALVSGTRAYGLKAHGAAAADRRQNRVELTRFLRHNWAIVERQADGLDKCARIRVMSRTVEGHNPERFAVILRFKKPARLLSVEWEGKALAPGSKHGFQTWEDAISLLLQVNLAAPFGGPERFLTVRYDSPFF